MALPYQALVYLLFVCVFLSPYGIVQAQQEDAEPEPENIQVSSPSQPAPNNETVIKEENSTEEETGLFPGGIEQEIEVERKPFFSFLDEPQRYLSSRFEGMARAIDSFFANEQVVYETSGSYVRLRLDSTFSEGGDISSNGDLKIRAHFPVTEKKLKLVLESDPDEKKTEIDRRRDTLPENQDKSLFAGFQTQFGRTDKWRFKPSLGVKLHSPIEYLLRMKAFRNYQLSDKLSLNLSETLYWFNTTGYGADTNIDLDRILTENILFRSGTFFGYSEFNHYWDLGQTFTLTHILSERRAISYQAGVYGNSDPGIHATDYLLLVRYRQNIHSNYLFLEVAPQILYRKEYDFKAEHSLLLRLEMLFRK